MNITTPYTKKGGWMVYVPYPDYSLIEMGKEGELGWKWIYHRYYGWHSFFVYAHGNYSDLAHPFPKNWFVI